MTIQQKNIQALAIMMHKIVNNTAHTIVSNLFENLPICLGSQKNPEYFTFLILRFLELFARDVCKFLKK